MHTYAIYYWEFATQSAEIEQVRAYTAEDALTVWHTNNDSPSSTKQFQKIVPMEDEK